MEADAHAGVARHTGVNHRRIPHALQDLFRNVAWGIAGAFPSGWIFSMLHRPGKGKRKGKRKGKEQGTEGQ
jgi:hypothetical protein